MNKLSFSCQHEFDGGFNLNLDFVSDRQVTALFGPSGSGKSTILSMICGFTDPQIGKIQVGDSVLLDSEQRISVASEKRKIGIVTQNYLLFPHMNVQSNLKYGENRSRPPADRKSSFDQICEVLELQPLLNRYPRNLSGGESQRVAIGRALISEPKALLLDEPLSALDSQLESRVMQYLQLIIEDLKIPVVFVTHRQAHVRRLAEWVVVIDDGKKVTEGVPDEAFSHARPLGWKSAMSPVNLLRLDRLQESNGEWTGVVGNQTLHLPRLDGTYEQLFLQFEPSDITLSRTTVDGLSSRNQIRGVVRQIVSTSNAMFVAIDIGQIVWAEITRRSASELELETGSEVICLIKAQTLKVVQ